MKILNLLAVLICLAFSVSAQKEAGKPKISFSFDDGNTKDQGSYSNEKWNQLLLGTISKYQLKTMFFVCGSRLKGEKGESILHSWDQAGQLIANHTYTHPYFNSKKITLEQFEADFLKNDSLIRQCKHFQPYFRFPYLKEGDTEEKVVGFREFMKKQAYQNGHVSIDASDWYIDDRLVKRLNENPEADVSQYRSFYIEHLFDRAKFYDSLATELSGRKISHVLLLHHNLSAALFLDELIHYFQAQGWEIINTDEAYADEIYKSQSKVIPAGESLIWSLAKQSGKFERVLRYPAEDGEYEKAKMDLLGL